MLGPAGWSQLLPHIQVVWSNPDEVQTWLQAQAMGVACMGSDPGQWAVQVCEEVQAKAEVIQRTRNTLQALSNINTSLPR
jgi:hypothetical protein